MPKGPKEHNPAQHHKDVAEFAEKYDAHGLYCIPLKWCDKRPVFGGWQKAKKNREQALAAIQTQSKCNIGVILGDPSNLVDIDLDSPEARALAPLMLPPGALKINKGGDITHYMYRCEDAGKTKKYQIPKTEDDDGGVLLELRGNGGQTMIPPSIHPNGTVLEWQGEFADPSNHSYDNLAQRCRWVAAAAILVRYMAKGSYHDTVLCVAGGLYYAGLPQKVARGIVKAIAETAGMENIQDRLNCVDSTYERGKGGDAIAGWKSLEEFGYDPKHIAKLESWLPYHDAAFEELAAESRDTRNEEALESLEQLVRFDPLLGRKPIVESELELTRRFPVLVGGGVIDLTAHPQYCCMTMQEFQLLADTYVEAAGKTKITGYRIWRDSPEKQWVDGERYFPGRPRLYFDNGSTYHNSCFFPIHITPKEIVNLRVFLEHCELIWGTDEYGAEFFYDWLAYNVQQAHERCRITPLNISHTEGMGRSWYGQLFRKMFGHENVSSADIGDILNSPYHDYLADSVMCVVDEIGGRGKKYESNEKLRYLLTESYIDVNVKSRARGTRRVYTSFFLASNHHHALKLTDQDRRIWVTECMEARQSEEYYAQLFSWLNRPEKIGGLWRWCQERDVSAFAQRITAPMTTAKKRLIEATQSGPEAVIKGWLDENSENIEILAYPTFYEAIQQYAVELGVSEVLEDLSWQLICRIMGECGMKPMGKKRKIRAISEQNIQLWATSGQAYRKWVQINAKKVAIEATRIHTMVKGNIPDFDDV